MSDTQRDFLDTYPEGNSDYGTFREQLEDHGPFEAEAERYVARRRREGQRACRRRRLSNASAVPSGEQRKEGQR